MLCRETEQPLPALAFIVHVYLLSPSSPYSSRSHCLLLFSSPCEGKASSLSPSSDSPCRSVWRYSYHSFHTSLGRQAGPMLVPEGKASLHHTLNIFVFTEWNRKTSTAVPHTPIMTARSESSFCHCIPRYILSWENPDLNGFSLLFTSDFSYPPIAWCWFKCSIITCIVSSKRCDYLFEVVQTDLVPDHTYLFLFQTFDSVTLSMGKCPLTCSRIL